MKLKFSILAFSAVSLASAFGQTFNATSGTSSWNVAGSWTPSGFPNSVGASATFNSPTAAQTVNLSAAITVGAITLANNGSSVFTLANGTGGSLILDATGSGEAAITLNGTSTTTNNLTISAGTTLNDTVRFTNNNVAGTGAATATMTGTVTGSGGFIKDGAGRFSFSTVAKTYTGATVVNQGRLRMTGSGQITGTSSILVNSGGSLYLDGNSGVWSLGAGMITLNGDGDNGGGTGTQGAMRNQGSGTNTLSNAVALGSAATIHTDGSSVLQLNGGIFGSSKLTKTGGGTLQYTTANSGYTGGASVTNGAILVNSASKLGTGALSFDQTAGNSTSVTLNNATQSIGGLSSTWVDTTGTRAQTLTLNGTALTINQSVDGSFSSGAVSTLTSVIAGTGSVIKDGAATLTLGSTNTYTGTTTVNAGKLVINGNISTSTLTTVASGGTLGGSGTVGALTVLANGTLAPGNSPGILNAGNSNLQASSTLGIEINGATLGTQYDQLNVTGTVTLAGLLSVTMGYTPADSALFFIIANDGLPTDVIAGTFSNAPVNGGTYNLGGQDFKISYFGDSAGNAFTGGNDVVLMAVPEPAAALLGSLGLLTLLRRRR
jgi:fibronectin-binding autotransporter adhesin